MITVAWLVWILPLGAAPVVPIVGVVDRRACKWFAVAISGLTGAAGLYQAASFVTPQTETLQNWVPSLGIALNVKIDGLSVLLAAFVSLLSFAIITYAAGNMAEERAQARFYSLILLFLGSMLGLVMAGNLIQLYFFWELVGICSAFLIAFWNDRPAARDAGFKAFIVTRFGDVSLFIAVLMILTTLGTTNIDGVTSAAASHASGLDWTLVGILILIGAMGKSAQVPLHVWLPDAMEGPTPVSALIHAATMVNAGVYLVARLFPIFDTSGALLSMVLVVGLVSMLVGGFCASAAEDLKRVLAYSTISQLGLMFAAIGLGSWQGAILLMVSMGLSKALAFMAAGSVIEATGTRDLEALGGLRRMMKYTYVSFLFAVLAMVGLPPLIGFWTKDAVVSLAASGNGAALLVIVLGSVLTSYYCFRAFVKVFHGVARAEVKESRSLMVGPMLALVGAVTLGWLVLGYQTLLPVVGESLGLLSSSASLLALAAGFGITYLAFVSRPDSTRRFVQGSAAVRRTKGFLLNGLGFDRAYATLVRSIIVPLVDAATGLQTGDLGNNVLLFVLALFVVLLLALGGVI